MELNNILKLRQFNGLRLEITEREILLWGELQETGKVCPDCGKEETKHTSITRSESGIFQFSINPPIFVLPTHYNAVYPVVGASWKKWISCERSVNTLANTNSTSTRCVEDNRLAESPKWRT